MKKNKLNKITKTKERQYQSLLKLKSLKGLNALGVMVNHTWNNDPARLLFSASRYKFVSKMLAGKKNVLEIGCADGFFSRIVKQNVKKLTIIDFDSIFIDDFQSRYEKKWPIKSFVHDIVKLPIIKNFDAIYSLDVLEHIKPKDEIMFFKNTIKSLNKKKGVFICGMPSLESQKYASKISKAGHVNCKSGLEFKKTLDKYFNHTFIFSMNDEVVHTGFFPMSHYLITISCGIKG